MSFRTRPCPWFYSLPLFIFRRSVNVKQRAWEIIQRQWTRGTATNLCHWHCDLCRQFVTREPGDLCDITEKNIARDQRWDAEPRRAPAPRRASVSAGVPGGRVPRVGRARPALPGGSRLRQEPGPSRNVRVRISVSFILMERGSRNLSRLNRARRTEQNLRG